MVGNQLMKALTQAWRDTKLYIKKNNNLPQSIQDCVPFHVPG